jgi:hypothetical protein
MTRKYNDRKRGKPTDSDFRAKIRDLWDKAKPANDERRKQRQENLDKLKGLREERDKNAKDLEKKMQENDKKKERIGKCNPVISLMMGAVVSAAQNAKREGEHPYDWTSDYFDEAFVTSDDRLKDWPEELKIDQISADVDEKKWMKKWNDDIDMRRQSQYHSCNHVGRRSLDRRCAAKRSLEGYWFEVDDEGILTDNATSPMIEVDLPPAVHVAASSRELEIYRGLEKRNPIFGWIISLILQLTTRFAQQVVVRVTAAIATRSPQLRNLLKASDRLFQIAKPGQGMRAGVNGMKNAQEAIKKDKNWLRCLKEGIP